MTSRPEPRGDARVRLSLAAVLASLSLVAISGCAALPEDAPVMEQLDDETGVTIARLGRPLELYRETFQRDPTGRFAFLAPFETNRMGTRELYLWAALPVDIAEGSEPDIEVNGKQLKLGTPGRDADFAGLRRSPYKIPTPWSAMYYYKIDQELVETLGAASTLSIRVTERTKDGTAITVFASRLVDPRLKDFADR